MVEELNFCNILVPKNLQIVSGGAWYLVGDPASKVLDGEFREGHFWLQIQWVVAMVIVTLLEKGVVRCLMTRQQTVNQLSRCKRKGDVASLRSLQWDTCGKQLWSSKILNIPWGLAAMRSMQGWLSLKGMSCQGICSLLYSSCVKITWPKNFHSPVSLKS